MTTSFKATELSMAATTSVNESTESNQNEETIESLINSNDFKKLSAMERFKLLQKKQAELETKINSLLVQIPQEFRNVCTVFVCHF